ncbi:MAG: type I methionyl aminopeptidase [bacterium]
MSIKIKTAEDIEKMRTAGKILADILEDLKTMIKPGISTGDINRRAEVLCKQNQVIPAFKNYHGFPASVCTGIDDVAVHGIPTDSEILAAGQIISVDMGVVFQDFFSDSAFTAGVGKIDEQAESLLNITQLALQAAISKAIPGNHIGDIGAAIEAVASLAGFSVIVDMTGHGIGRALHEDPSIPCFGTAGRGAKISAGMTFAIEPMINEGTSELIILDDNWTTKTADGGRSAIFEHTILVSKNQPEILTKK